MTKFEVVFMSYPAIGHLVPVVEFAHHLINHDPRFSVTILIITMPERPILNTYVQSHAATLASTNIRFIHLPTVDPPSPDQFESPFGYVCLFIEKHRPHVKQAITNLMETELDSDRRLVGIITDMFCTSMIDVANELDIPCYVFFPSPATFLGFMLHLPILDTQLTTELAKLDTELVIPSFANPVSPSLLPSIALEKEGYSWFLYHGRRYFETMGIIINTVHELEPYALNSVSTSQVPQIYPMGPILDLVGPAQWHPNQAHDERVTKWLDDQPPSTVVFISFGSRGSFSESQVREIALGLEQAGVRFVWVLREQPKDQFSLSDDYTNIEKVLPNGFLERTAGIGLICGWVSQVQILSHKAVGGFISHCGWNSILESLWHGIPIATWPIYAEQQMNAFEMVKELGLAIEIRLDYREGGDLVSAKEVERGIKLLMNYDNEKNRSPSSALFGLNFEVLRKSYTSHSPALDRLDLEDKHHHWVRVALAYAREIKDFDDLVYPRRLFDCCLGPNPSRYSKEKYARIRSLKNEPLSNLATDSKKRKLGEEKGETATLPPIHIAPSSPTPSLEVTTFTPPTTRAKGKGKARRSVWDDPTTAMGRAHNVITNDELKGSSSIPSHKLVSYHIHKLVQVLGESLRITTDYLNTKEKVEVANSKVESIEVECSKLRKDLIVTMNETNNTNEKIRELIEALHVEKVLVVQKDEEIQETLMRTDAEKDKVVQEFIQSDQFSDLQFIQYFKGFELLCRRTMKHHNLAVDFSNFDFEKIDTEILIDKAKEQEETEAGVVMEKDSAKKDVVEGKDTNKSTIPPS